MSENEGARWRESHAPARYWSARGNGVVQCHLSPRGCTLREGQYGFCGVRRNVGGELRSLNYGKSIRATQEFVETEAIYHYAPGARILSMGNLGCMMSCDYCHNWQTSQAKHVRDRDVHHYTPAQVVERALALGVSILSWTYNDPVVWQEFVVDTARLARAAGLLNLYKSAFYIQEDAARELCEHMDIFSLSLKSMDHEFYRKLTKGTLEPVLKAIEVVVASGRHLELSNLMVTGANDNENDAALVARWLLDHCPDTTPLHFVRFHPDYKYTGVTRTPIDRLERGQAVARALGVKHVYVGNVAEHAGAHSYCSGCGARVVTRYGMAVNTDGLSAGGTCTACGTVLPFRALDVVARDRAARAVSPATSEAARAHASGAASTRHAWPDEILSAHIEADNPGDEVVHVGWLREGAGDAVEAVAIPPRTTHRFVVARSGPSETAFRIGGPATIRVFDLLDRAHFHHPGVLELMTGPAASVSLFARTDVGDARAVAQIRLTPEFRARYELGEVLGSGAMGMVCRARDLAMNRVVAIKFMTQFEDTALKRFLAEARVLAHIRHPNVVPVYDIDALAGHPYLVTELLEGGTLRARMDRLPAAERGTEHVTAAVTCSVPLSVPLFRMDRLPLAEAIPIFTGCLAGLAALHAGGVVHRDIKPENILFTRDGDPRIADLGLAKELASAASLTRTGTLVGTPLYMSPEQARMAEVTPAADVWALAAVLYEVLAGRVPFRAGNLADLLRAIVTSDPSPLASIPGVPPALADLVHRALAKSPADRPDAEAFAAELEALTDAGADAAPPPAGRSRPGTVALRSGPSGGAPDSAPPLPGSAPPSPSRMRAAFVTALLAAVVAGVALRMLIPAPRALTVPSAASAPPPSASASTVLVDLENVLAATDAALARLRAERQLALQSARSWVPAKLTDSPALKRELRRQLDRIEELLLLLPGDGRDPLERVLLARALMDRYELRDRLSQEPGMSSPSDLTFARQALQAVRSAVAEADADVPLHPERYRALLATLLQLGAGCTRQVGARSVELAFGSDPRTNDNFRNECRAVQHALDLRPGDGVTARAAHALWLYTFVNNSASLAGSSATSRTQPATASLRANLQRALDDLARLAPALAPALQTLAPK